MFVKRWAKFQNINSAKDGTISSYVLSLMVIHYLQYGLGDRPLLPCLQLQYPVSILCCIRFKVRKLGYGNLLAWSRRYCIVVLWIILYVFLCLCFNNVCQWLIYGASCFYKYGDTANGEGYVRFRFFYLKFYHIFWTIDLVNNLVARKMCET